MIEKTARKNPRRSTLWTKKSAGRFSLPIAFVKLVAAVGPTIPARSDPDGTLARWNFPMACHPFIALVPPRPITGHPFVLGRRLREHHFLLRGRRSLRHNDRSVWGLYRSTRGGGSRLGSLLPWLGDDHLLRRWRRRWRCGNHMGIWLGGAASHKGQPAGNQ